MIYCNIISHFQIIGDCRGDKLSHYSQMVEYGISYFNTLDIIRANIALTSASMLLQI